MVIDIVNAWNIFHRQKYSDWFKNLWDSDASLLDFYVLANEFFHTVTGASLDLKEWFKAWHSCTVLHIDYKQAKEEFFNAVFGLY